MNFKERAKIISGIKRAVKSLNTQLAKLPKNVVVNATFHNETVQEVDCNIYSSSHPNLFRSKRELYLELKMSETRKL